MIYITHHCFNKRCNNAWVDQDLLRSGAPPKWKKCRDCAGAKFDKQKPKVDKELSERLSAAGKAAVEKERIKIK